MSLLAVFLANIVLISSTILSMSFFNKRKDMRSLLYIILWVIWSVSIVFKIFAELSYFHATDIGRGFGVMSLWVNAYAYVHLISLFNRGVAFKSKDILHHVGFGIQALLWSWVSIYITKNAYPMAFFNVSIIVTMILYSIKYNRWWFTATGLFTANFFFFTGIGLYHGITVIPLLWLLTVIGAVFAIIGTYVNGNY